MTDISDIIIFDLQPNWSPPIAHPYVAIEVNTHRGRVLFKGKSLVKADPRDQIEPLLMTEWVDLEHAKRLSRNAARILGVLSVPMIAN